MVAWQMHVHHGLEEKNPVARLRFFPKQSRNLPNGRVSVYDQENAREIQEIYYKASLPRDFEDKKLRGSALTAHCVLLSWLLG